jgi:hypothetical protein
LFQRLTPIVNHPRALIASNRIRRETKCGKLELTHP